MARQRAGHGNSRRPTLAQVITWDLYRESFGPANRYGVQPRFMAWDSMDDALDMIRAVQVGARPGTAPARHYGPLEASPMLFVDSRACSWGSWVGRSFLVCIHKGHMAWG